MNNPDYQPEHLTNNTDWLAWEYYQRREAYKKLFYPLFKDFTDKQIVEFVHNWNFEIEWRERSQTMSDEKKAQDKGIRAEYRKCGKPTCRCAKSDFRHGPYFYRQWREQTKIRRQYIGLHLPDYEQERRILSTAWDKKRLLRQEKV